MSFGDKPGSRVSGTALQSRGAATPLPRSALAGLAPGRSRRNRDHRPQRFSSLDFSQRFKGTFSDDGQTIDGRWETSADGTSWREDFKLIYTKVDSAGRSIPLP
jgi:hypothetical protein